MSLRLFPAPISSKPHRWRRPVAATAIAAGSLAVSFLVAVPPAWAMPSSLTGEVLGAGSTSGDGGILVTSATCSQTSSSTITFTASGTVPVGPYLGSFTESGEVTLSATPASPPQFFDGVPLYLVSRLDAFFTITSPSGTIGGTEHLGAFDNVQAICATFNDQQFGTLNDTVTGFFGELQAGADGYGGTYDAIITTPGGSFEDVGQAGTTIEDSHWSAQSGPQTAPTGNVLNTVFQSSSLTPIAGVGNVTGGGQINPNGNPVTFGFEAKSENGLKGQCDVVDQAAGVKVHCSDVTSWAQVSPTEVEFFGDATVNGAPTTYVIDTQDLANPGSGADTFSISTGTGYQASGTLTDGNIQIHTS